MHMDMERIDAFDFQVNEYPSYNAAKGSDVTCEGYGWRSQWICLNPPLATWSNWKTSFTTFRLKNEGKLIGRFAIYMQPLQHPFSNQMETFFQFIIIGDILHALI